MLSPGEWSEFARCVRESDRYMAGALHARLMSDARSLQNCALATHSDAARLCMKSALHAFGLDIKQPQSRSCCLTGKTDDVVGVRFSVLADDDQDRMSNEQTVVYTVHRKLVMLLRCAATLGMIWLYVIQEIKEEREPDYKLYACARTYAFDVLKKYGL